MFFECQWLFPRHHFHEIISIRFPSCSSNSNHYFLAIIFIAESWLLFHHVSRISIITTPPSFSWNYFDYVPIMFFDFNHYFLAMIFMKEFRLLFHDVFQMSIIISSQSFSWNYFDYFYIVFMMENNYCFRTPPGWLLT